MFQEQLNRKNGYSVNCIDMSWSMVLVVEASPRIPWLGFGPSPKRCGDGSEVDAGCITEWHRTLMCI
jgi:hypothetical protein